MALNYSPEKRRATLGISGVNVNVMVKKKFQSFLVAFFSQLHKQ
jgi:hypothetical protein